METTGVSDSGEYIAGTADNMAIHWRDNEPEELEDLDESGISGINSAGTVVGYDWSPWTYRDDAIARLLPDSNDNDQAVLLDHPPVINDQEAVVAAMTDEDEGMRVFGTAQHWKRGKDRAASLPFSGELRDINSDGVVVGSTGGSPYIWDIGKGIGEELPQPADYDEAIADSAASGWATTREELLWDLDAPATQPQEVELDTVVDADADGTVYGELDAVPALENQNGEQQLLPAPEEDSVKPEILGASADGSTIVGNSRTGDTSRPQVWSCR